MNINAKKIISAIVLATVSSFAEWDYYKKKGYRDLTTGYHARGLEDDAVSVANGVFADILNSKE